MDAQQLRPVYVTDFGYGEREEIKDYRPGGLHPIHLGDLLGEDGRYRIVHKLGNGGFGTVWLCRDTAENKWKALKILRAEDSTEDCADFRICNMFENMNPVNKQLHDSHIAFPTDHFWLDGPNGRHLCVVMPLLGPNIVGAARKYEYQEAPLKDICRQLVSAMAFLHKNGVCHGDFRPHNICHTVEGLDDASEHDILMAYGRPQLLCIVDDDEYQWENQSSASDGDRENMSDQDSQSQDQEDTYESDDNEDLQVTDEQQQSDAPESENSQQNDVSMHDDAPETDSESDQGEVNYEGTDHCPRYLVVNAYLDGASKYISNNVAVIDFGESFLNSQPRDSTGIPSGYCSPEGFFDGCGDLGFASDVWALGCTLFEVRQGSCPFGSGDIWSLMPHWEDLSGPMPEPFRSSLADDAEVPEDPQQWASIDEEEKEDWNRQHMLPSGISSALLQSLSTEIQYLAPLAEGEVAPTPPPQGYDIWCAPGNKVLCVSISQEETSLLFDLAKKIFCWAPEDRLQAAHILQHAWLQDMSASNERISTEALSEDKGVEPKPTPAPAEDIEEVADMGMAQLALQNTNDSLMAKAWREGLPSLFPSFFRALRLLCG